MSHIFNNAINKVAVATCKLIGSEEIVIYHAAADSEHAYDDWNGQYKYIGRGTCHSFDGKPSGDTEIKYFFVKAK